MCGQSWPSSQIDSYFNPRSQRHFPGVIFSLEKLTRVFLAILRVTF